jgi:sugar/nucleoside kinase (ribokinase family)
MICLKPIGETGLIFDHIVGTGGIGSGIFFSMSSNQTLGRNESRMARLLPVKDFCKLHILMHYIAVLLGAKEGGDFQSFPIGKVGNDDIGKNLIRQMKETGMATGSIDTVDKSNTLFSVCFQYPDHSGGNITTENSASSQVLPEDISFFFQQFKLSGKGEIILAAPEVPLVTRMKLLEYGRQRGSLNAASILSTEVDEFRRMKGFEMVDILSVNIDEARSIAEIKDESESGETVIDVCIKALVNLNPSISILITDGPNGSYCYSNNSMEHTPVPHVSVVSTAGAGDAFLSGTLAGLCCGLPLSKGNSDLEFSGTPLKSAVELGTLLASLSVTSHDTIHPEANAEFLYRFAKQNRMTFGQDFTDLFRDCS